MTDNIVTITIGIKMNIIIDKFISLCKRIKKSAKNTIDEANKVDSSDKYYSIRVHKYDDRTYQVQVWDYDNLDMLKAFGKCWNTIHISNEDAVKLNVAEGYALFDDKETAIKVKEYFEQKRKNNVK